MDHLERHSIGDQPTESVMQILASDLAIPDHGPIVARDNRAAEGSILTPEQTLISGVLFLFKNQPSDYFYSTTKKKAMSKHIFNSFPLV